MIIFLRNQKACYSWYKMYVLTGPPNFQWRREFPLLTRPKQLFELMGIQKFIHGLKKIVAHCRLIDWPRGRRGAVQTINHHPKVLFLVKFFSSIPVCRKQSDIEANYLELSGCVDVWQFSLNHSQKFLQWIRYIFQTRFSSALLLPLCLSLLHHQLQGHLLLQLVQPQQFLL